MCEESETQQAHIFHRRVNWLDDSQEPCHRCKVVMDDQEQFACDAYPCLSEGDGNISPLWHDRCLISIGDGLVCMPCAAAGRLPFTDEEDNESEIPDDDSEQNE